MRQVDAVKLDNIHHMADMLDKVKPWEFDLSEWVSRNPRDAKKFLGLFTTDPGCGFAGCAMGWAAHQHTFPGLSLMTIKDGSKWAGMQVIAYVDDEGKLSTGFTAACRVFKISLRSAEYFFHPQSYSIVEVSPAMVASRLRRFAAKIEAIRARVKRPDISALKKFTEVKTPINA